MIRAWLVMLLAAMSGPGLAAELSARAIVERAHAAAGGESWRRPATLHLVGSAVLYRDGVAAQRSVADHYEMWRVFPAWNDAAHGASGKVRIDARAGERLLFQTSFDGERTWNQDGEVPDAQASREWSEAFGFGIIRFALDPGFKLTRMADDQVEGVPCHFVQVEDPSGGSTLFGIDARDFNIRLVGFDTPRGWHQRIYSDFFWHQAPKFIQPGRVRLYYRGALTNDIRWTRVAVDAAIPDATFVLARP